MWARSCVAARACPLETLTKTCRQLKARTISGTGYLPMRVWDGERHRVRFRFRERRDVSRNRGFAHVCVQTAAADRCPTESGCASAKDGRLDRDAALAPAIKVLAATAIRGTILQKSGP